MLDQSHNVTDPIESLMTSAARSSAPTRKRCSSTATRSTATRNRTTRLWPTTICAARSNPTSSPSCGWRGGVGVARSIRRHLPGFGLPAPQGRRAAPGGLLQERHRLTGNDVHELERRRIVLRLLAERGSVSLQQLTTVLGASEPTVRRDLYATRRAKGCSSACTVARVPLAEPRNALRAAALRIDLASVRRMEAPHREGGSALVTHNESIIVTGGSTTFALVEQLGDRNLQVLTTSLPHADYLLRYTINL